MPQVCKFAAEKVLKPSRGCDDHPRSRTQSLNLGFFRYPANHQRRWRKRLAPQLLVLCMDLQGQFPRGNKYQHFGIA